MGSPYELAQLYVQKGPPYWFVSKKQDAKFLGKKEGGAGGDFGWSRNMWYAKTDTLFVAMWTTGKVEMEELSINGNMVVRVIHEKETAEEKKAATAAVAATQNNSNAPVSAEHVDKQTRKDLLIPVDLPEDLTELKRRVDPVLFEHPHLALGMKSEEMVTVIIKKSRFLMGFGPRSGISDAKRVIRALDLEVCKELKHIIDGTFEREEREEIARRNAKRASRSKTSAVRNWAGDPLQMASANGPVSDSDPDCEAESESLLARKYPKLVPERPVCQFCENVVSEESMDCGCGESMPNVQNCS